MEISADSLVQLLQPRWLCSFSI